METNSNKEFPFKGLVVNGFLMIFFTVIIPFIIGALYINCDEEIATAISLPLGVIFILGLVGYIVQQPNETRVMIFFGKYVGTFSKVGFYWVNPFISRKKVSLRIRNMDIEPIKVNDKVGNPVLIGMVLVWKIKDTYRVIFDLDSQSIGVGDKINNRSFDQFVRIQSDAALREVAGQFAYDSTEDDSKELTLRDGSEKINDLLEDKINERLAMAGIEVVEARLNYLAYAPEIAAVMLRRQQAAAIITAREKIVEGAVTMVEMALDRIEERKIVHLSEEKKADMVGNLLMILCGDEPAQPVISTSKSPD